MDGEVEERNCTEAAMKKCGVFINMLKEKGYQKE
jgi:hypothetical protein